MADIVSLSELKQQQAWLALQHSEFPWALTRQWDKIKRTRRATPSPEKQHAAARLKFLSFLKRKWQDWAHGEVSRC